MRISSLLVLIGLGFALFALVGCNDDDNENNTSRFAGTVQSGGRGIEDATVFFLQNGRVVAQTTTNATGAFTVSNLRNGVYTVITSTVVNGTTVREVVGTINVTENVSGFLITLVPDATIAGLGVIPPQTGLTTLVAFATDENGNPIQASVQIDAQTPVTDTSPVIIRNFNPTTATVRLVAGGETFIFPSIPLLANTITVVTNGTNITPGNKFTISGTVKNSTGAAVSGANMRFFNTNGKLAEETLTHSNGTFTTNSLAPGTYNAVVTQTFNGITFNTVAGLVTITNQNVTGFNVTVPTEEELDSIIAPSAASATLVTFVTDANGNPIQASVQVDELTPVTGTSPIEVRKIPFATGETYFTQTVTVAADGASKTFETVPFFRNQVTVIPSFVLNTTQEGFAITGTVYNEQTEESVAGVHVILLNSIGDFVDQVNTDAAGDFAFAGIPNGTYTLKAEKAGFITSEQEITVDNADVRAVTVIITPETPQNEFTVSGTVFDASTEEPIAGATLGLRNAEGDVIAVVDANASGEFIFTGITSGTYTLIAEATGFATSEQEITVDNADLTGLSITLDP